MRTSFWPKARTKVDRASSGVGFRVIGGIGSPRAFQLDLERQGHIELSVFDVRGRLVRSVVNRVLSPGTHTLTWDGRSTNGHSVSAGVYFVRLSAGRQHQTGARRASVAWPSRGHMALDDCVISGASPAARRRGCPFFVVAARIAVAHAPSRLVHIC